MMKLTFSAYLVLIIWLAAVVAFGWFMYAATEGSRMEFWNLVAMRPATETVAEVTTLPTETQTVSTELRARLSDGLATLATSLETYKTNHAMDNPMPTAEASGAN